MEKKGYHTIFKQLSKRFDAISNIDLYEQSGKKLFEELSNKNNMSGNILSSLLNTFMCPCSCFSSYNSYIQKIKFF